MRAVPLGDSRHPALYCAFPRRLKAPAIRVVLRRSYAIGMSYPGFDLPYVRWRSGATDWPILARANRIMKPLDIPLTPGGVSLAFRQMEHGPDLYSLDVEFRSLDVFLVFLRPANREAQRWFGWDHRIEAGWVSEYRWSRRALESADRLVGS